MVTTVTTATSAVLSAASAASLTLLVVLLLIALLINKEIFSILPGGLAKRLSRALNVTVIPLAIVFAITLVIQVVDALR
ncbi:MAG: hypothetical protein DIU80_000675 [Chloroflexota bacterium]|nr:MAG: hypothetical protein DIU80_07260 [Chloroflexota bacterium]